MRGRTWGHRWAAALLLLSVLAVGAPQRAEAGQELSATASASVDDATVGWDDTTTVRGSGWAPGKVIKVILYAGATVLAEPTAAADGSIAATIRIPSDIGSSRAYRLAVQGFAGDGLFGYVEVPLTIIGPTPTQSIASDDLHWDETTTVSGQRYKAGAAITVSLFPDNTLLANTTADANNSFSVPVQIPSGLRSARDYQVVVTGQGIDLLFHFDAIEVTITGNRPTIDLSADRAPRGGTVDVSGQIFLKGTKAVITLVPGYETLGEVAVAEDGTFLTTVKIPDRAEGRDPHAVVVTGQGQDGLFAYLVERLDLGNTRPASSSGTISLPDRVEPPEDPPGTLAASPPVRTGDDTGDISIGVLVVFLLVALVLLLLILLAARRDVRRDLRRRRDALVRRVRVLLHREPT